MGDPGGGPGSLSPLLPEDWKVPRAEVICLHAELVNGRAGTRTQVGVPAKLMDSTVISVLKTRVSAGRRALRQIVQPGLSVGVPRGDVPHVPHACGCSSASDLLPVRGASALCLAPCCPLCRPPSQGAPAPKCTALLPPSNSSGTKRSPSGTRLVIPHPPGAWDWEEVRATKPCF